MNSHNLTENSILGFDELFETGVIVDGTGADLEEVSRLMKEWFAESTDKINVTLHGIS